MDAVISFYQSGGMAVTGNLNSLKNKSSQEWREYATQCMVEILNNKDK